MVSTVAAHDAPVKPRALARRQDVARFGGQKPGWREEIRRQELGCTAEQVRGLAEALGLESEQTGRYPHGLARYDFVFNTVPAPVFTAEQLRQLSPACVLIDLSSAPYGIPPEACAAAGVTCRYAPGLPGKCAPKSAGLLYAQQILLELESEEPQ